MKLEHGMMVRRLTGAGATAETIVWIHGLGESSASFEVVAQHPTLARFAHVLVDLPGYGRAPWDDAPTTIAGVVDRLVAWLAGSRPILAGHSLGGVFATLVAEKTPIRAVIDIDGNLSRGDCTFSAMAAASSVDEFAATGLAAMRDAVYLRGVDERPLRGYAAAMTFASPRVFHAHAKELVALSETETLAPRLVALPCPHLFVAGVPGGICAYSRALLDQHRANWVALEPAGHWVHLDRLDAFVAHVDAFVQNT